MPSVSSKQEAFMQAIANNKKFAKKAGVSQEVGKEFNDADKVKKKPNHERMYKSGADKKKDK